MSGKKDKIQGVYEFKELSKYSFKKRFLIKASDLAFFSLILVIGKTLKYEQEDWENFEAIEKAGKIPIYTFWHNRIFAGTYYFRNRGIVVMTSQSFDGEYIARFIQRLGYGTVRGSSSRGAVSALVELIRVMKKGLAAGFTIDGPKGPRYVAKMGACLLAKKTGNPMMPFVVECRDYWEVGSWDKLQIPKPFTRVKIIIGKPIYVNADADEENLESIRNVLQKSLDELVVRGQQWRESEN